MDSQDLYFKCLHIWAKQLSFLKESVESVFKVHFINIYKM